MAFNASIFIKTHGIVWYSVSNSTQFGQQIWKVRVEILSRPAVQCDTHSADLHETHDSSTNYSQSNSTLNFIKILYVISWPILRHRRTDGRGLRKERLKCTKHYVSGPGEAQKFRAPLSARLTAWISSLSLNLQANSVLKWNALLTRCVAFILQLLSGVLFELKKSVLRLFFCPCLTQHQRLNILADFREIQESVTQEWPSWKSAQWKSQITQGCQ